MTDDIRNKAKTAVDYIIADLTDRRGLRQGWDAIDDEVREDIVDRWRELVANAFKPHHTPKTITVHDVPVCDEYPNCIHCSVRIERAKKAES